MPDSQTACRKDCRTVASTRVRRLCDAQGIGVGVLRASAGRCAGSLGGRSWRFGLVSRVGTPRQQRSPDCPSQIPQRVIGQPRPCRYSEAESHERRSARTRKSSARDSGQIWLVDGMKSDRFTSLLGKLGITAIAVAGMALVFAIADAFPWSVTWELWTALTAMGTIAATLVALALALRGWLDSRAAAAKVVAAWVTDEYRPREDGSSYRRTTRVHIANEANEPVFNATVSVHVGRDETPLGPLSVPAPISVLPPRRELVFDISIPLLAHLDTWSPKATLYFTDPQGRRWLRMSNGELRNVSRQRTFWSKSSRGMDERQLGDMTSVLNPMMVALAFLAGLRDPGTTPEELVMLLAPEARGWAELNWDPLRSELQRYQPTSMVDYPAERIARIKLSGDATLEGRRVEGQGLELNDYMFMTLTLNPKHGWRVFSVGGHVPPDAIFFDGSLLADVLPRISRFPTEDQER